MRDILALHRSAPEDDMQGPVESFRIALWVPLAWVLLVSVSLGVPLALVIVTIVIGLPPATRIIYAVSFAVAVADIAGFIGVCAVVAYFRIDVGPEGVRTYNTCCVWRTVAWADVRSVRRSGMPGLRSLKFDVPGARFSLAIPLCLSDLERFYQLVCQYAGAEHPLARALNEEMSEGR
jgi:hypothetical protein